MSVAPNEPSGESTLRKIFNEALERQDTVEQARFLDAACGTDSALRKQVEELLRAHERIGGFLADPADRGPAGTLVMALTEKPGDTIGRYKLLQQIGEGGCGVVYMAEQAQPVRRRVALKVIKLGMDTKRVVARFEVERQVLALMDHPNIAKVLDAGATESGRPYFVMELVRGSKITEFCDQQKLSPQERLKLFMQVCSAIQHAHQKGIIHRDVKPSNILVTMVDGVAVPKVIDFGIAKATTNQPLTDKTLFTAFEQFLGTPAYMSPEQAQMSGVDIDTRTDIYSLGVVLYELLTGKTPFDSEQLIRAGLDEIRRTIREQEPPKPSTRLNTLAKDDLTTVAKARQIEPPKLIHLVQGDLDWVVMKCLEKDRNRRYETANGLAADIQRHLSNEPVIARPASNFYRFKKLIARHRAVSLLSMFLILSLLSGSVVLIRSDRQLRRSLKAEHSLRTEQAEALHSSLLAQARAKQQSRTVGQQFESIEVIRQAAQIRPTSELRSEAAVALTRPDVRRVRNLPHYFLDGFSSFDFSPDFAHYASGARKGFALYSASDGQLVRHFERNESQVADNVVLSPDSRWIGVLNDQRTVVEVWSAEGLKPHWSRHAGFERQVLPAFRPDGAGFAYVIEGEVHLRRFDAEEEKIIMTGSKSLYGLSFSPENNRLAIAGNAGLELWDITAAKQIWALPLKITSKQPAWRGDGQYLAVGEALQNDVTLIRASDGKIERSFCGHSQAILYLAFHPGGQMLASLGDDRWLRFWNVNDGVEILRSPAAPRGFAFSKDGTQMGFAPENLSVAIFELARGTTYRQFIGQPTLGRNASVGMDVSDDGRLIVTSEGNEIRLWDAQNEREVDKIAPSLTSPLVQFGPGGNAVFYSVMAGVMRREIHWMEQPGRAQASVRLGEEKVFAPEKGLHLHDISLDGKRWLAHRPGQIWMNWPEGQIKEERIIARGPGFRENVTFSPDERWFAGESHLGEPAVWDAGSGQVAIKLPTYSKTSLAFTADGKWLLTGTAKEYVAWETGKWRRTAQWQAKLSNVRGGVYPSPDSKLAAFLDGSSRLRLVSMETWEELLTFEAPSNILVQSAHWSPDSQRIYLVDSRQRVHVWEVARLHAHLTHLGLGW